MYGVKDSVVKAQEKALAVRGEDIGLHGMLQTD
jgi:hypothetical protein